MAHNVFNIFQSVILILLSPLVLGVLKKIKAVLRGFVGVSIFQVYYDLAKLLRKQTIRSNYSSFITEIGPVISLGAAITTALMIPIFFSGSRYSIGNLFLIIFLLSIVKFFNTLVGLDSSSAFGGMGTSRELFLSMIAEPVIYLLIMFLYFQNKTFNIFEIAMLNASKTPLSIGSILAFTAFFIVILVENSRLPIDNPETHLELTMIHEAMILDLSGKDLVLIEMASIIKFSVFLAMLINMFIPFGLATVLTTGLLLKSIVLFLVKILIVLFIIALIEVSIAKSRLFRAPDLIAVALSLIVSAISLTYFIK